MYKELLDRLKKNSKIKLTAELEKSKILNDTDISPTEIPAINIAFSGSLTGGLTCGLTMFAGASSTFKSLFALICAKAYMAKHKDSILLFYDSEMGSSLSYFKSVGIDTSRVIHSPITNVEELKFDLMNQLNNIERGDSLVIVVDSVGNLASKKEVEDTINEKSAADMTRAKQFKSLTRQVVPVLNLKNIPMIVINHTYDSLDLFSRPVIGGGQGWVYGCQNIFITSKSQEKHGQDLVGWNFTLSVFKSRFSREKSRIPITVLFNGGILKWSGLLDMALESGNITKPSQGWYSRVNTETGEVEDKKWRANDTNNEEFWKPILSSSHFSEWVENNFKITNKNLLVEDISNLEAVSDKFTDKLE